MFSFAFAAENVFQEIRKTNYEFNGSYVYNFNMNQSKALKLRCNNFLFLNLHKTQGDIYEVLQNKKKDYEKQPKNYFFTIGVSPVVIPTLLFGIGRQISKDESIFQDEIQFKTYYGKSKNGSAEVYGLELKISRFKNLKKVGFFSGFNIGIAKVKFKDFCIPLRCISGEKLMPTASLEVGYSFNSFFRVSMDFGFKIIFTNLYFTLAL